MTSATDNRTAELRGKLTERGVKYQAIGKRLTYWNRDGSHNDCDDADFVADEQNGYLIVEGLTPEQAIAATLGNGECRITASSTDGLTSDEPRHWFMLSCGHSFTVDGLDAPVACPVCGKAVEQ